MSSYAMETGEYGELGELEGVGEFGEGEFGEFGEGEWGEGELGEAAALSEGEQAELASELLEVASEAELEQFLGKVFRRVARGVSSIARSPIGRALGGALKSVAKTALPMVGGALGSMIAPGIGTAIGSRLGSAASNLFEVELETLPQEHAEFEVARRVVNLSAAAARNAARARPGTPPRVAARAALQQAAQRHAPGLYRRMARGRRRPRPGLARPHPAAAATATAAPAYASAPTYAAAGDAPVGAPFDMPLDVPGDDSTPPGVTGGGRWVRRGNRIIVYGA